MRSGLKKVTGVKGTLYTIKVEHAVRTVREVVGIIIGDEAFIKAPPNFRRYRDTKTYQCVPASQVFKTRAQAADALKLDHGCFVQGDKIVPCRIARDSFGKPVAIGAGGELLRYHTPFESYELAAKYLLSRAADRLKDQKRDLERAQKEFHRCAARLKPARARRAPRRKR